MPDKPPKTGLWPRESGVQISISECFWASHFCRLRNSGTKWLNITQRLAAFSNALALAAQEQYRRTLHKCCLFASVFNGRRGVTHCQVHIVLVGQLLEQRELLQSSYIFQLVIVAVQDTQIGEGEAVGEFVQ